MNTAYGVERVVRYAFEQAAQRRKKLTLVHKTNVLTFAGGLWKRIVDAVAAEHPEIAVDYLHVDAATIFLVTDPARFDVIVTDNLFGDILTDLAAAISGGIGLAASGNINPAGAFPSMFEPVHGSAPDIAGQQKADPTAAILSTALLLRHLGRAGARRAGRVRGDRRPRRPHGRCANDRRDRRRDRRAVWRRIDSPSRKGPVMTSTSISLTSGPTETSGLLWNVSRNEAAREAAERAEILADPGFGNYFTDHMVDICWSAQGRLAPAARVAVRAHPAGALGRGAPLRAGDLRGAEGVPPRRRLDLGLPAGGERRAHAALGVPPRAARAAGRALPRLAQAARSRSTATGCRTRPRRASTCGRSCSRRRRSSACARRTRSTTT